MLDKKVKSSVATQSVKYLSADDEDRYMIAQSDSRMAKDGKLLDDSVRARIRGDFPVVDSSELEFMDVSPNQILSVAAALIPFLEHDDANRALMGSNMQRQSVPLMNPKAPIVGTGIEQKVAQDSYSALTCPVDGEISYVDSSKISIKSSDLPDDLTLSVGSNLVEIPLKKYWRTNQNSSHNQRPLVKIGEKVKKGDVIADGASCQDGELALGSNVKVAFMPWRGYNFEDAIVISERLVTEDIFTSLHINEIDLEVRDTKRGEEELTSEIPNVSEDATRELDENGIIRIGAKVQEGDIIIGKVSPKGETDPTPEEKLLKAIFGEKAGEVKDSSRRADPGVQGVVLNTKLFQKRARMSRIELKKSIQELQIEARSTKENLKESRDKKLLDLLKNQISGGIRDMSNGRTLIKKSTKLTEKRLKSFDMERFAQDTKWIEDNKVWKDIKTVWRTYRREWAEAEDRLEREVFKLRVGDELQPGILRLAKVYVANKRRVKVGDKMAGRHGNKGIVATIVPEEDMPFTEDGTPVDIVLNPLGVPSRMNLGQLYETMLGWAGEILGLRYETPAFDGASPELVEAEMKKA